jgi:acetyl-CoA acyltransferase
MKTAVVVDCLRLPIGRAHSERGYYRHVRGDDLAVRCLQALLARNAFDPREIDDVILGCTQQYGEQGHNVARMIAIMAGVPLTAGACTVNRLCGSSLQALHQAVHAIQANAAEVQLVGGLEHMQHVPMEFGLDVNPKFFRATSPAAVHMGVTAEFLAQSQRISRTAQDQFALRSHQNAFAAANRGAFQREIIPTEVRLDSGELITTTSDQCVRADTTLEALAQLEPAFMPKLGTVTAGNSSPLNDGAAALLVMSAEKALSLGLTPLARVHATTVAGVEPCLMGTGPVPAIRKLLEKSQLSLDQIDLIEINEAFAAQTLACARMLKLDEAKLNVHGGAIALGHPLGASGARIATTLIHALHTRGARWGIAAMCIGFGQGIATLFERLA